MVKMLIIEDSMTQAQRIAAQLSQYDIDVIVANDGMQGLRIVDIEQLDLIVLDVNLPTINGYQVCKRLKRDPNTAHIPVIMFTAATSSGDTLAGLDAGADDYIVKDRFAFENLLSTLQAMGFIPGTT